MSTEQLKDKVIDTLARAAQAITIATQEFGGYEIDGTVVLAPDLLEEIENAIKLLRKTRPDIPSTEVPAVIDAIRDRAPISVFGERAERVVITKFERHAICLAFDSLTTAFAPFTRIKAPPSYTDGSAVTVSIKASDRMAEEWALEYDMMFAMGCPPPWPRPDVATGKDYPTEILSTDDITVADLRYAESVKLAVEPCLLAAVLNLGCGGLVS